MRTAFVALLLAGLPATAFAAGQSLIPSPYPSGVAGAHPLNPAPAETGEPQTIMRDPYPQATGDNSQGNPPIARRMHRQRLIPSIYKRKYGVERHGGAR